MNNLFKERLNEIIKESGATQSKIVKTTKINKGALSCYLKGLYSPKRDNIVKLATFFNVNPDWLEGKDVPKNSDFSYVDYNNIDTVAKYYDIVVSTTEQKLDNNMKSLIAHILKNNNIISNISEFTNKKKEEIISFINDNKKILNDKKILIDISEDNK